MIDSMFQEGTDQVLNDRVTRPVAAPAENPSFAFSTWNTIKAPVKGVVAGANESVGFASDILGAFGQVQAGIGLQADPTLLFDSDGRRERIEQGAAARSQVESGEAFSTELGTGLRVRARELMPDAQTSNVAENLLFGLSRFATKAVGYTAAGGPVLGPIATGVDEGMTEADRLKAEGVDIGTRTKVGFAAGLSAAAATALPVAGNTIKQTVGLVAAGGPGAFIAQQAASKSILQNSDYDKIAEQYDPFDPVGLAVSTLVPAGFGAYASRGRVKPAAAPVDAAAVRELSSMSRNERTALRYDDARLDAYTVTAAQREGVPPELMLALKNAGEKSGPTAVSPKGAAGVAQLMEANRIKYGVTDAADPIQSIDGMAKYLKDTLKQYDGNIQAVIADYNGGPRQANRVMKGMAPQAVETIKYLKRVNEHMAERQGTESGRAAANDPEAVAAARVQLVRETVDSWNLKDPADVAGATDHLNAISQAADQIGAGGRVDISRTITLDNLSQARMLDDFAARLESARADVLPEAANVAEPGAIASLRDELASLQQSRPSTADDALRNRAKELQTSEGGSYKASLAVAKKEVTQRIDEIDSRINHLTQQIEQHGEATRAATQVSQLDSQIAKVKADRAAVDVPTPKKGALAVKQAVAEIGAKSGTKSMGEKADEIGTANAKVVQSDLPPTAKPSAATVSSSEGTRVNGLEISNLEAQSSEIAKLTPDLMVQLEGMDAPMKLSEALEFVKAEAAREAADAPLLQVAAECFLRQG